MSENYSNCEDDHYIKALVVKGLQEVAEDSEWIAVLELRHCANRKVFEIAKQLTQSKIVLERNLGVNILAQLGYSVEKEPLLFKRIEPFWDERINILIAMLDNEVHPSVLASIATGLGHFDTPLAITPLLKLKTHTDDNVRFGVVFGLMGLRDEPAIQALIELSQDEDSDVRDWATFGLGSILDEVDTPAIREALYLNLDDSDEDTRYEALTGLIIRRDRRIIGRLIDQLSADEIDYDTDIGEQICAMLIEMQNEIQDTRLIEIIAKCKSQYPNS